MTIWRLHVNTSGGNCADICLKNKVMAMGWSITDRHIENFTEARKKKICEQRVNIHSYKDYEKLIKKWKVYDGKSYVPATVRKLYWEVKPDDLVWIRYKGIYYLGRVGDTSQWAYKINQDNLQKDAAIQRTDIEWLAVGDESTVPGFVATAFIKGRTLQRINSEAVQIFSQHYYNTKIGKEHYQGLTIEANPEEFYDLLSPTDCEDLVCAYLSYEYKYIVIPSTNKKSTELYECILLDPEDRSHVYIQVKKGNVDIDGTLIETSTDQGALKTYNDVYYVLFRDCLGPDKECGKMVCKKLQNPSGRIGLADQKSSKYYLQVYKVEDDGHNIAGSGTLYNE